LSGPTVGRLQANLKMLIRPQKLTQLSSLTPTPIIYGGVTDAARKLVFPNARYFVSQIEADFWTNPQVSLPKMKWMRSSKEMIAAAQKQLGIIQPRLTRFAVNQEIILVLCHSRTRSYTRAGSN